MIETLIAGLAAGFGIAIPVGVVTLLIVETGIRSGFRAAAAAGAGTATADGIYAGLAAAFGVTLAGFLGPWQRLLRAAAVVVLVGLAARGFRTVARDAGRAHEHVADVVGPGGWATPGAPGMRGTAAAVPASREGAASALYPGSAGEPRSPRRLFVAFLALTLLNPMTVTYFAALILGLGEAGADPAEKVAFVAGAFGASLAWQTLIAAFGAALRRRLAPGVRLGVGVAGNLIVLAFAAVIASGLVR
jgi:threonine/homoserine/homoserine lactone efflux protein